MCLNDVWNVCIGSIKFMSNNKRGLFLVYLGETNLKRMMKNIDLSFNFELGSFLFMESLYSYI